MNGLKSSGRQRRILVNLFMLFAFLAPPELEAAMEQARVVALDSADTFRVQVRTGKAEREEEVRLVGIDAPDRRGAQGPEECKAKEALEVTRRLILDKWVSMEPDPSLADRDAQGRLLRYVYVLPGPADVGAELLEQGYARTYGESRFRELTAYWRLENAARELAVGVWDETCVGRVPNVPTRKLPATLSDDAAQKIQALEARTRQGPNVFGGDSPVEDPCCLLCAGGKACGDTCIPEDEECKDPPGCACDAKEL